MLREDVRQELLRAALERRTVTYGLLMLKFGFTRGGGGERSVVAALSEIDRDEARKGGPGFAALVVRKDTGFPGGGFFCWKDVPPEIRRSDAGSQNPRLSEKEKEYVRGQQEAIWNHYRRLRPDGPRQESL